MPLIMLDQNRLWGFRTCNTIPASIEKRVIRGMTHVDFGFSYDRDAIFVLYRFASCERDTKMRKHGTFRWRKEIIRDKSNGFDGGVSGKVMTHGQGYSDNLNPRQSRPYQNRGYNPEKELPHQGKVGQEGAKGE